MRDSKRNKQSAGHARARSFCRRSEVDARKAEEETCEGVQAEVEAVQADEAPMGLETDDDKLHADFEEALREVQATEARPVDKYTKGVSGRKDTSQNKKQERRKPCTRAQYSTCIAMCVPTQNARLGYHFQPPSRTKTIEKIIAVLAAAHHALASAAADRASHWAAMPNHQPSCFARSKLPCDQVWHIMPVELGVAQLTDDIDC